MSTKRKRATDISTAVRRAVKERDGWCCIFCRKYGWSGFEPNQIMHFISRGRGGRGIEENLALGCAVHHQELDNGKNSSQYREFFREYLEEMYPDWNEWELYYNK